MTQEEIEGDVCWLLNRVDFSDDESPQVVELARRALGPKGIETVPHGALPGDGCLATVNGKQRIYVRTGLTRERLRWVIAHELGHYALGLGSSTTESEDACDAFAAALLIPLRAFRLAVREAGSDYVTLARRFAVSESCIVLRHGEATGCPIVLVAPSRVRVRGDEFAWGTEQQIRALAKGSDIHTVKKERLSDDRRRVALSVL